MRIETIKDKIYKITSKIERIAAKNQTLPVLSCLLFEVENNILKIKATNIDLGFEAEIPVKVEEGGKVAVPSSVLNNLISNIQGDNNIILETINNNLQIKSKTTKTIIKTHLFDDFPTIPKISDGLLFSLDSKNFIDGLKSVFFSSSLLNVKPELSSVFVYVNNDDLFFVATDSFRLAEKKIKIKKNKDFFSILIPLKNISDIIRVIEDYDGVIDFYVSKNQISFSYNHNYLVSRVIDGVFPDYKQIIPNEFKTEVIVLKQDLLATLKISNIFSDKFNQVNFKINPSDKIFEITTKNADIGESVNSIQATLKGELISVNFNHKYITDCLQFINSDSISLSFGGLSKPLVIQGVSDKSFVYIVMPMNK